MSDEASEASSRIAVDIMLVQCKLFLTQLHPEHFSTKRKKTTTCPSTPGPQRIDSGQVVKIFPELEVYVDVEHPKTETSIRVTGRADWGFGYGGRVSVEDGTFLVAIEAKRRELFSTAETQLMTYLAILRERRKRAGKINAVIQGFYTDGYRYCFMSINTEGVIEASRHFYIPGDTKTIFNFIIAILESAIKSSPNVSPTKPAVLQEKEVGNYKKEVWDKIYLEGPKLVPTEEQELLEIPNLPWFKKA
jgi:hypothetical protein